MGIREDNGWVSAEDYTMRYSALIKMVRVVVVAQPIVSLEKEQAHSVLVAIPYSAAHDSGVQPD